MLGLLPALQGRLHVRGQLGLTYAEQTQLGDGRCTHLSEIAPATVACGVENPSRETTPSDNSNPHCLNKTVGMMGKGRRTGLARFQ